LRVLFQKPNLVYLRDGAAPAAPWTTTDAPGERLGRSLALPDASFDYAACLFSTLGMVRGRENRAKVLANAYRLLKLGGRFVLHAHNRWYRGLGVRRLAGQFVRTLFERPSAGDVTMPQAYGGAPLTLHHFILHEVRMMLWEAGFATREILEIGPDGRRAGWPRTLRAYGWLILSERPVGE
jgi:SAM-dependent methyltransferase